MVPEATFATGAVSKFKRRIIERTRELAAKRQSPYLWPGCHKKVSYCGYQAVFVASKWPFWVGAGVFQHQELSGGGGWLRQQRANRRSKNNSLLGPGGQTKATTGSFDQRIRVSNDDYSMTKLMIDTMVCKNEPKNQINRVNIVKCIIIWNIR
jgi:hypothetical protein